MTKVFDTLLAEARTHLRAKALYSAGMSLSEALIEAGRITDPVAKVRAQNAAYETQRACIREQVALQCMLDRAENEEKMRAIRERQPKARAKPQLRLVPAPVAKPAPKPADKYETLTCDVFGDVVTATLYDPELEHEYDVEVDFAQGHSSVACWYDLRSSEPVEMPLAKLDDSECLRVQLWASRELRSEWEQDVKRRAE